MEADLEARLKIMEAKLDMVQASVEKTKRYLWWGFILQLGMVLVPLLLIMLAVPFLMQALQGVLGAGIL